MLESLTKDDLKKYFKLRKLEAVSFLAGVELLRMHEYNREVSYEREREGGSEFVCVSGDTGDQGQPAEQRCPSEPSLLDQQRRGGLAEGHPARGEPLTTAQSEHLSCLISDISRPYNVWCGSVCVALSV